jgi:hypothetical protein
MNLDSLNDLPDWEDEHFNDFGDNEGEEWKPNPTREACKALYKQWQQVVTMLRGAFESGNFSEDDEMNKDWKAMTLGDAFLVGAKLRSSEAGNIYVLRMENAAIIRKNAQSVASSLLSFMVEGLIEEKYAMAIRVEIDTFRELFKHWISTFVKDEYEDEWGLFV